jgi:hypothetical protein
MCPVADGREKSDAEAVGLLLSVERMRSVVDGKQTSGDETAGLLLAVEPERRAVPCGNGPKRASASGL